MKLPTLPTHGPMRGVPREATGSEEVEDDVVEEDVFEADIGLTPKVGGKGRSDTSGFRGRQTAYEIATHHRDTPPEDVYVVEAGLLAHGSVLLSGLPEIFPDLSDFVGQRLTAYSCGGSAGITPASLLAPDQAGPGEPRRGSVRINRDRSQ